MKEHRTRSKTGERHCKLSVCWRHYMTWCDDVAYGCCFCSIAASICACREITGFVVVRARSPSYR